MDERAEVPIPRPRRLPPAVERVLSRPLPRYRGWSHRAAAVASASATVAITWQASGVLASIAACLFGVAVTIMFVASSIVHWRYWTSKQYAALFNVDFTAIFVCIAGTTSGVALLATTGWVRVTLVVGAWLIGAAGSAFVWSPRHPPPGLMNAWYLLAGWFPVAFARPMWQGLGASGALLLVAGGLLYTLGAVIVGSRRPDPWPEVFGYHEIFHLCVVAAAALHFSAFAFVLLDRQ